MDFDFYKLQIAGNDIILVNYTDRTFPSLDSLRETARRACRRDYGIGGNGFIAVGELSKENISALYFDPAGALAETTIDAALCLARYVFNYGVAGKEDFKLTINDDVHSIGVIDSYNFRISLGIPKNDDGSELVEHPDRDYIRQINAGGKTYPVTVINMQKTGIVVFSETCNMERLKNISDEILKAAQLDPSQRLIFATVNGREELDVHIRNSRGDDFSTSCAIAAAASVVNGFLDRNATILHKRDDFYFQWLQPSNEIFLTGSPDYIFSGSMYIDSEFDSE